MSDNKKEFKTKPYAAILFFAMLAFLLLVTITTFNSRYFGFHAETFSENYVNNIIQRGDGYNAYKYTLLSKNSKFGDFVIDNYMAPHVTVNKDNKKTFPKSELTEKDDGDTKAAFHDEMYKYYLELLETYGYDDYDSIFSNYFERAASVREGYFGDNYITTDILFAAFEENVNTYGQYLAGAEAIMDDYKKDKVIVEAKKGLYDELYGDDYKIVTETVSSSKLSEEEVKAHMQTMDLQMLEKYKITLDDINTVNKCVVESKLEDGTLLVQQELYLVKIGKTWYVDNTTIDTSALYDFYK